jgi:hypothetical protein
MSAKGFQANVPFNSLPKLRPAVDLETRAVLKGMHSGQGLAELNAAADLIPNPTILINTLPILEARASSEIENIVTTADRLLQFAADDRPAPTRRRKRHFAIGRPSVGAPICWRSVRSAPIWPSRFVPFSVESTPRFDASPNSASTIRRRAQPCTRRPAVKSVFAP